MPLKTKGGIKKGKGRPSKSDNEYFVKAERSIFRAFKYFYSKEVYKYFDNDYILQAI